MLTDDYRVQLDAFEGPLDLLLFLIRKNEVEVEEIPVARVTEQYLKFLEGIEKIDIEVAGEFLVMAATLMEIKSRMLMPKPVQTPEEAAAAAQQQRSSQPVEDPRAELVRQLLAYKKFRDAADALENRADEWSKRFPAGRAAIDDKRVREAIEAAAEEVEVDDLDLLDLVDAFKRISETVNFERLGEHQVKYDDTPVELHAEDIVDHLRNHQESDESTEGLVKGEVQFVSIFRGRNRSEMIGLFLALLHLLRKREVAFRHHEERGIMLRLRTDEERKADAAMVGSAVTDAEPVGNPAGNLAPAIAKS
jgi:segregation and condensation protein A